MVESVDTVKMRIIEMLTRIYDITKLHQIAESLSSEQSLSAKEDLFQSGGIEIKKANSFDEVFENQGSKRISYEDVLVGSENIEWEYSLEEMLEALD